MVTRIATVFDAEVAPTISGGIWMLNEYCGLRMKVRCCEWPPHVVDVNDPLI